MAAKVEKALFKKLSSMVELNAFPRQPFLPILFYAHQIAVQLCAFAVSTRFKFCSGLLVDSLPKLALFGIFGDDTSFAVFSAWILFLFLLTALNFLVPASNGVALKPLLLLSSFTYSVLSLPICHAIFTFWKCEDGASECWTSLHLFWSLVSIVLLSFFIAWGLICTALLFPRDKTMPESRVHGRLQALEFIMRISLTFIFVFAENTVVQLIALGCFPLGMLYFSMGMLPFHSKRMNSLCVVLWGIAAWSAVCAVSSELGQEDCDNTASILLYTGLPLSAFLCWLMVQLRFLNVEKRSLPQCRNNPYLLELKARLLLSESEGEEAPIAEVLEAFRHASLAIPSALLHYFFAKFFAEVKKNHHMAANQQAKAKNMSPPFDIRFFLAILESSGSAVSSVAESQMEFEELLLQTQEDSLIALKGQLSFWNFCVAEIPDLGALYRSAKRVYESTQAAEAKFKRLFAINPHSTVVLKKYSAFLTELFNDEARGHEMLITADRIVEKMSNESDNVDMTSIFENIPISGGLSLMDDRNAVITISLAPEDFGDILNMNAFVSKLFGFQASSLVGNKINLLLPPLIDEQLLTMLEVFIASGQSAIVDTTRTLLVLHRSGHLVPVLVTFHPLIATSSMVLAFRGLQKRRDYLLVSGTGGRVLCGTERSLAFLKVKPSELQQTEMPLKRWLAKTKHLLRLDDTAVIHEDLLELDGVKASKIQEATSAVFRDKRKESAKLVLNSSYFSGKPESAAYIVCWDLESPDFFSPASPPRRVVKWQQLRASSLEEEQPTPTITDATARVKFLLENGDDGEEEEKEEESSLGLGIDTPLAISRALQQVPDVMAEDSAVKEDRGSMNSQNSANVLRNALMASDQRDSTVKRLHVVVILGCLVAILLGIFLVSSTNDALATFERNVHNIAEAGHRAHHIQLIAERVVQLGEINLGRDHADEKVVSNTMLLFGITEIESEQDYLFNGRDPDLHPAELIELDQKPLVQLKEYTSTGKEVDVLATLNEAVRLYSSRGRVYLALPSNLQNADHPSYKFIANNVDTLIKVAASTTNMYEAVANSLADDIIVAINLSFYLVTGCLVLIFCALLVPILWKTELAKNRILGSFLGMSLIDLEVLVEASEEKVRARLADDGDAEFGDLDDAEKTKKRKRHHEKAASNIKVRRSYRQFWLRLARFGMAIGIILAFFSYVYFSVHSFKTSLETFTAEMNFASQRLIALSRSAYHLREMGGASDSLNRTVSLMTETASNVDRMLELHHNLLYGNSTLGLPGSLGRMASRDYHLMVNGCGYISRFAEVPCVEYLKGIVGHGVSAALTHYYQMVMTAVDERLEFPTSMSLNPVNYDLMENTLELYQLYLADGLLQASLFYETEVDDLSASNQDYLSFGLVAMSILLVALYFFMMRSVLGNIDEDIKLSRWMLLQVPPNVVQQNAALFEQVRGLRGFKDV